jgi:hypothetical protein
MANEIRITASLSCNNGEFAYSRNWSDQDNQTTPRGGNPGTIAVTTTDSTVSFGNLTTPKWCLMKNIGTAAVDVGCGTTFTAFATVPAGAPMLVPLASSATVRVKTSSGTSVLQVEALDA